MLNRLLLSLLSMGIVAGTMQGSQDNSENPSYFHFRRGTTGDDAMDARYKPIFWPKWGWQRIRVTSGESERAAFVQSLQEISKRSRAGAKEGLVGGLVMGGIYGTLAGTLIGTIAGYFSRTLGGMGFSKSDRAKIGAAIGASTGAVAGGLGMAAFYTPALADEGIRVCSPSACDSWALNEYCKNAHDYAYNQLSNFPGITPELAAILAKVKNNQEISAEENHKFNTHTLRFTTIDDTRLIFSYCLEDSSLADIACKLNETHASNRKRIPAVIAGGTLAKEYAQKNKFRTFIAASKDERTLGHVFDELKELDKLDRMQQTYDNVSKLSEGLEEELASAIVPEIIKEWK